MNVGRVRPLLAPDGVQQLQASEEATVSWRHVRLKCNTKLLQIEERHGGIHVMLDVIVHVPVQIANNRVDGHRVADRPPIGDVLSQAGMLGRG